MEILTDGDRDRSSGENGQTESPRIPDRRPQSRREPLHELGRIRRLALNQGRQAFREPVPINRISVDAVRRMRVDLVRAVPSGRFQLFKVGDCTLKGIAARVAIYKALRAGAA